MTPDKDDFGDIDARLAELSSRTALVRARPGFSARVMDAVRREPSGALHQLQAPAWRLFPVAILAAALALVWAVSETDATSEALAVGYDDVELEW